MKMKSRKSFSITFAAILTFALNLVAIGPFATTATATTVVITNEAQLLAIQSGLTGSYTLGASFSLSETNTAAYIPGEFRGTLNGNGFKISDLTAPLFNEISGSVSNINLVTADDGVTSLNGRNGTGVLSARLLTNGSVTGVHVAGIITTSKVEASDYESIGGLIGQAKSESSISNSSASVNITDTGSDCVGGLVGLSEGISISASTSSGSVTTSGVIYAVGGFVGCVEGNNTIVNSAASGNVSSNGWDTGGFAGYSYGGQTLIKNSQSSGSVTNTGTGIGDVGGFIGYTDNQQTIQNVFASGKVTAEAAKWVGGLIGDSDGDVSNSLAIGDVSGRENVGGLIGENVGIVSKSRAKGSVTDTPTAGALIGMGSVQSVGPTGTDLELLNDDQASAAWGQNQNINGGKPYLVALINRGFYQVTTPPAAAPTEEQVKAAAAAAAAKREAEVKTARAEITSKLKDGKDLSLQSFAQAGIPGVTSSNFAEVQADILALPAESRTDINQVLKVAFKYEVVGKIASGQTISLPTTAFVEIGLIPATSKNKIALVYALRKLPESARDSYAEIKTAIDAHAAKIQARKDRLATVLARSSKQ